MEQVGKAAGRQLARVQSSQALPDTSAHCTQPTARMARAVSKAMVALAPDYGMTEDAAALRLAATCEVLAGIGATDEEVEAAV
ncbi:MAG: hypothetical protein SNJ79_06005, partial [Sphingomonadaceae bacterium]